jgi:uncharacterized repeat protein (TIGR03843 family)
VPADELSATPGRTDGPALDTCGVLEALRLGDVEVLGRMPWSSNATLLVNVRHGENELRAVYKPRRGERPLWDFPSGLDRREAASWELSQWLGWGLVPETILRHDGLPFGTGSLQRFVPFDVEQHYFTLLEDEARHDALRTICAFDLVANSADRKGGHCLAADDGAIYAIDNGLTFHEELKLRTVVWDFGGEQVPQALVDDVTRLVDEGAPPAVAELVTSAECAALLRRAAALLRSGRFPVDDTGRRFPWPLV